MCLFEFQIDTVTTMFEYAQDFFQSIGLYPLTQNFWDKSYLEQVPGQISVCHASAWDFFSNTKAGGQKDGDFRLVNLT